MSDSELEWFEKDDETLLREVQKSVKKQRDLSTVEYVQTNNLVDYIIKLSVKCGVKAGEYDSGSNQIPIVDLRKFTKMSSIDVLLHVLTLEYDFYSNQICLNDSEEKILLYTSTLALIYGLELPGFSKDALKAIAYDDNLQQRYCLLLAKLVCKRHNQIWQAREAEMLEFIQNLELLVLKAFKLYRKVEKMNSLLKELLSILNQSDNPTIKEKEFFISLKTNFSQALIAAETPEDNLDIFPSLAELLENEIPATALEETFSTSQQTAQEYVTNHMRILKNDVFLSIKGCLDLLKNASYKTPDLDHILLFDDVTIVLNDEYLDASRQELLFVDFLGPIRGAGVGEVMQPYDYDKLIKIKVGSLLCLSTSKQFENLILAVVTFASFDCVQHGYIGIQIVRQYNIGNIYNKTFILFETPEFFEPYHNVFNFLKNCNLSSFPLKNYFVNGAIPGKRKVKYLTEATKYTCYGREFKPLTEEPPKDVLGLNNLQLRAFQAALQQDFCLIQGPPGTGKTHLSLQIIKTLIENADTPVVLVTYTNDSLDKLLVKMSQYTNSIVRFGSQSRDPAIAKYNARDIVNDQLNPKLKKLYYNVNLEFRKKFQTLQQKHEEFDNTDEAYYEIVKAQQECAEVNEKLLNIKLMFQYYAAKKRSLIALTTTCAAKMNFIFRLLKTKIVIFEEAAEILESHILASLTPFTEHVIMIGDHNQLQPYFSNNIKMLSDTQISFFEKIFVNQLDPLRLNTQYRMHPKIADLLRDLFYPELESDVSVTKYPIVRNMKTNLFFMTHSIKEEKSEIDASFFNSFEVNRVITLAEHLVQNAKYEPKDLHILSPYAKQVELFKNRLRNDPLLSSVEVSTVDSFQGLESNIILLSLVRSNDASVIGFLKQPNRICVALSRAKHGLFMIGNLPLLSRCSPKWAQIQEKLTLMNAVGSEFPIELNSDEKNVSAF